MGDRQRNSAALFVVEPLSEELTRAIFCGVPCEPEGRCLLSEGAVGLELRVELPGKPRLLREQPVDPQLRLAQLGPRGGHRRRLVPSTPSQKAEKRDIEGAGAEGEERQQA